MSRETNEGVIMRCKTIMAKFSKIVHLLGEPITSLAKPKAYIEAYISIRQPPWILTSSNPFIYPSLSILFYFINMLISNRYWWSTVLSYVGNISGRCRVRDTTRKMNFTASRNCISIINLIKGGYVLCWGPNIRWKVLLKKSWASCSENSLIPIKFS